MEGNVHTMSKGPCGPAVATFSTMKQCVGGWSREIVAVMVKVRC